MSAFRKKPVVIEATQWFKNGDHPSDYAEDQSGFQVGELRTFTGAERQANGWEGSIVRYYRTPELDGQSHCKHCGQIMHVHGWIDTLEGGHTVCPGDWVITGVKGEHYPCKPDIFALTYEPADQPAPLVGHAGPNRQDEKKGMSDKDDIMASMTIELQRDGRITVTRFCSAEIDPSMASTLLFGMLKSAECVIEKQLNREFIYE